MKKITAGILAGIASLAIAGTAQAQTSPFSVELRGGVSIPTGDFADFADAAELNTGYTVGLNGQFMFTPMLGIYAGYTYTTYSFDGDEAEDVSLNEQGFNGGVIATFATPTLPVSPFLKGGVLYNKLDLSDEDITLDLGDSGFGFEVGGGVVIPLGPRLSFTPGVTYQSFAPDFGDDEDGDDVTSIKVDLGLKLRI